MDPKKSKLIFKYKGYAVFSNSPTWTNHLKPDLIKIKEEEALNEMESPTEFEAVKRDIKRSTTIKIINRIINLIERADDRVNKL